MLAGAPFSIRGKLGAAFGAVLCCCVGVGLFSLHQLDVVNDAAYEIRALWLPKQKALSIVDRSAAERQLLAGRLLSPRANRETERLERELAEASKLLETWRADYLQRSRTIREKALFAAFERNWESYLTSENAAVEFYRDKRFALARRIFNSEGNAAFGAARTALRRLLDLGDRRASEEEIGARDAYERAWNLIVAALLMACILTAFAIYWISVTISAPLRRVSEAMKGLVRGDEVAFELDCGRRADEIGVLADAARGYRDALIKSRRLAADAAADRQRLDAAIRNMPIGLSMFDASKRLVVCNEKFQLLYGLPAELVQPGAHRSDLLEHMGRSGLFSVDAIEDHDRAKADNVARGEMSSFLAETRDGRWFEIAYQPIPAGGWVATHEDVTASREAQAEVNHRARHDPLTDLLNRLAYNEALDAALRASGGDGLAVLCFDLDRFKPVNDTFGHAVGDELLKAVARRLQRALRDGDEIARLGGDEFAAIQVDGAQPEAAIALAARVIEALSQPFQIEGHMVEIGVSIGVAVAPTDGRGAAQLLRCADMALYAAKAAGRGVFRVFEPGMDFVDRPAQA